MSTFNLSYWLRGSRLSSYGFVETPHDATIWVLKARVLELLKRVDLPLTDCDMYNVPQDGDNCIHLDDDKYEDKLGKLTISALGAPLCNPQRLSSIFTPQPKENHLHLILDISTSFVDCMCWMRGADVTTRFLVTMSKQDLLDHLRTRAKETRPEPLVDVPVDRIRLYKIPFCPDDEMKQILHHAGEGDLVTASQRVADVLNDVPFSLDRLYIVIEFSESSVSFHGKRKQNNPDDPAYIMERWRSKRVKAGLPTITELASLIDRPLSDRDKVPITRTRFEGLISSPIFLQDTCTFDDVQALFRPSNSATSLDTLFFTVLEEPPPSGTDRSFIYYWDRNVRAVVELLVPTGQSSRNSIEHTATMSLRPDYAFLLNNLCVFRGEEKGPEGTGNPKKELASRLAWAYDPAPYVLGYYAIGMVLTLVAISPPPQGQSLPVVHNIASTDLSLRRGRIKNICRLINLTGLFEALADLVQPSQAEFKIYRRDYCTVEIAGHGVIKSYIGPDKVERIERLKTIYAILDSRRVPHVDSLSHHFDTTAILSPRGIAEQPKTEQELLSAIICVLELLVVLHPEILHQDIRWPNVMQRLDNPLEWFLIDWDDAMRAPGAALDHFKPWGHSPRIFVDGHGTEVDMWGVGDLIVRCEALVSSELQDLGKWMKGSMAPSAQEALVKIKEYQLSCN